MQTPVASPVPPVSALKRDAVHIVGLSLVLGVYALSFFLPVGGGMLGFQEFVLAFTEAEPSMAYLVFFSCWLANPLLIIGVILLAVGKGWLSAAYSGFIGAFALLLSFILTLDSWPGHSHAGYFVWQASMLLLAVFGFWTSVRRIVKEAASKL